MNSIPIIRPPSQRKSDALVLLERVVEAAKSGKVASVALVMTDGNGTFRVTAAGTDIDGMRDGAVELFKQLDNLVSIAEAAEDNPKPVILNG